MASCAKTKANLKRPPLPVAKGPSNLAVVLDASPCLVAWHFHLHWQMMQASDLVEVQSAVEALWCTALV